jgi:hypothetical protein
MSAIYNAWLSALKVSPPELATPSFLHAAALVFSSEIGAPLVSPQTEEAGFSISLSPDQTARFSISFLRVGSPESLSAALLPFVGGTGAGAGAERMLHATLIASDAQPAPFVAVLLSDVVTSRLLLTLPAFEPSEAQAVFHFLTFVASARIADKPSPLKLRLPPTETDPALPPLLDDVIRSLLDLRRAAVDQRMAAELSAQFSTEATQCPAAPPPPATLSCPVCLEDSDPHRVLFCPQDASHQCCSTCLDRWVQTRMSEGKTGITCIHCPCHLLPSDYTHLLSAATLRLLDEVQREDSLRAVQATDTSLKRCVRCGFAVFVDPDFSEQFLHCLNPTCQQRTCLKCLGVHDGTDKCPESDDVLSLRHRLEEALTAAYVRVCPNPSCGKPFLKQQGCNRITCSCGTVSCYVCRRELTSEGYAHFGGSSGKPIESVTPGMLASCLAGQRHCPLWTTDQQDDVLAMQSAAEQTLARYMAAHADAAVTKQDARAVLIDLIRSIAKPSPAKPVPKPTPLRPTANAIPAPRPHAHPRAPPKKKKKKKTGSCQPRTVR